MLSAVEAALEKIAATGVASMTIQGRSVEYRSAKELLALRAKYLREVQKEQDEAAGSPGSRTVRVTFGTP